MLFEFLGHFFDQVSTLVDDGSDHDHDSHIMVWQVRDKQDSNPDPAPSNLDPPTNKLEVESRSSRGSSSTVNLGPSGVKKLIFKQVLMKTIVS